MISWLLLAALLLAGGTAWADTSPSATLGTPLAVTWWVGPEAWANAALPGYGGTVVLPPGYTILYLSDAAVTLPSYTVSLPAEPIEMRVQVSGAATSTAVVVKDQNGNTVSTTLTLPLLSSAGVYLFHVASGAWSRLQ